jgi:hypothetical protein
MMQRKSAYLTGEAKRPPGLATSRRLLWLRRGRSCPWFELGSVMDHGGIVRQFLMFWDSHGLTRDDETGSDRGGRRGGHASTLRRQIRPNKRSVAATRSTANKGSECGWDWGWDCRSVACAKEVSMMVPDGRHSAMTSLYTKVNFPSTSARARPKQFPTRQPHTTKKCNYLPSLDSPFVSLSNRGERAQISGQRVRAAGSCLESSSAGRWRLDAGRPASCRSGSRGRGGGIRGFRGSV